MIIVKRTLVIISVAGAGLLLANADGVASRLGSAASIKPVDQSSRSDSVDLAAPLYKACRGETGQRKTECYSRPLDSLASLGQVRTAMATLAHLGALDVNVKRDGHVYAHGIGIAAGKKGGDIAQTFALCDASNQSGCYHGVIQAYFAAAPIIGAKEINSLCEAFRAPSADQWIRFQCVHGTGHGLEMIFDHDLKTSLEGCDLLREDWDRDSCYGGAFMENIVNATEPVHPAHDLEMHMSMPMHHRSTSFMAVDRKDPLYPCSALGAKYQSACYQMQTSVILYLNGGDIAAAARTCDTAPFKMRFVCYQSLGRDISSYALQDPVKSKTMCSLGTAKYQPWCYFGLVKNFIDLNARASDGIAFCRILGGEFNKLKCYQAVGEEIATLRNDAAPRRSLCDPSESDYLDACLFGAGLLPTAPVSLERLNATADDPQPRTR